MSELKPFDKIQLSEEQTKIVKKIFKRKLAIINTIEELSLRVGHLEDDAWNYIYEWYPELEKGGFKLNHKTGEIIILSLTEYKD